MLRTKQHIKPRVQSHRNTKVKSKKVQKRKTRKVSQRFFSVSPIVKNLFTEPQNLQDTNTDAYPFCTPSWLGQQFTYDGDANEFQPKHPHLKVLALFPQDPPHAPMPPGSIFFDMNQFDTSPTHGKPNTMPTPKEWERAMGSVGVTQDDDIVVVDQPGCLSAARFWWMSIAAGVNTSKIRILQGGNQCYQQGVGMYWDATTEDVMAKTSKLIANYSTHGPQQNALKFNPHTFKQYCADNEYVVQLIEKNAQNIAKNEFDPSLPIYIDTRPPHMFAMGRPAGAVNVPYHMLITDMELGGEKYIDGQSVGTTLSAENHQFWSKLLDNIIKQRTPAQQTKPVELIFGCQTATTASTGFLSLWSYITTTDNPQHTMGSVLPKIFDPSWYVYGNKNLDIPGVANSTERRHYEVGEPNIVTKNVFPQKM